ncbi:LemA protein [Haloechinothrix alba]|uniref:LemA protein n=1 Tax=Haloechinothrix alba TaxID=664784 RepID=A0A238WWK6_9PSEU|nr:LemA family protein [Haloechinothrix alba]SNR50880.1 LemA protein [Haloechinothrix alba]
MGIALILTLVGVLLLAGIIVFAVISTYNGLVRLRNAYKNAFAQIDVQLTRRHDLIPNLIETAKGYMQHERETLEEVVSARSGAVDAQDQARNNPGDPNAMQELSGAENMLTQSLGKLFALSESYPDLKANQNMMQLSEELTSTENRVAFARQSFNDAVMAYNNKREAFPGNLIAGMFGFEAAALLEVDDPGKREAPEVSF